MSESTTNASMSYEEFLANNEELIYRVVGISMLPLIRQDRDLFVVRKLKPGERPKRLDVVLYHGANDQIILHRVLKVEDKSYVIRGDNCVTKEYGIRDGDILGVMSAFIRDGKRHEVNELPYRVYVIVWQLLSPLRIGGHYVHEALRKLKRRTSGPASGT